MTQKHLSYLRILHISILTYFFHYNVHVVAFRLLRTKHAGPSNGSRSAWRAHQVKSSYRLEGYESAQCNVDPGGLKMVHLPLHRHPSS